MAELPKVWMAEWGLGQLGPSPCLGQLPLAWSSLVQGFFKSSFGEVESNSKACGPRSLKSMSSFQDIKLSQRGILSLGHYCSGQRQGCLCGQTGSGSIIHRLTCGLSEPKAR